MMKVSKHSSPLNFEKNQSYNQAISSIVQNMMQTEDEQPIAYVPVLPPSDDGTSWWNPHGQSRIVLKPYKAPKAEPQGFVLSPGVGEYEKLIASCLAWGSYSSYILTGEMGSGKSTTLRFIREELSTQSNKRCNVCTKCRPLALYFNFNKGFGRDQPEELLRTFRRRLVAILRRETRRVFNSASLTDGLFKAVQEDDWEGFDIFVEQVERDKAWLQKSEKDRVADLFEFLGKDKDLGSQLELLMQVLGFIRISHRPNAACLFTLYDNIDSILPEAQYDIIVEILRLQEFAKVKAIIAMRRGTFARLNNQAAYSFGVINHHGPSPSLVLRRRLEHWSQVWENKPEIARLEPEVSRALRTRLEYLLREFSEEPSTLQRLTAMAGASVRNGLYTAERLFINTIVPWEKVPAHRDEIMRSAIIGENDNGELDLDDPLIANILASPIDGKFTTIHLRILQFLHAYERDPAKRHILNLIPLLRAIGHWDTESIRLSLNYLLSIRRPLIWVDGKSEYASVRELQDCNDRLHLTAAGSEYLSHLIEDLVYFQQAAISTDWPLAKPLRAPSVSGVSDRFSVLRVLLLCLLEQDKHEVEGFRNWALRSGWTPDVKLESVATRVIHSIALALARIVQSGLGEKLREHDVQQEMLYWWSFLITSLNVARELGVSTTGLASLEREYARLTAPFANVSRLDKIKEIVVRGGPEST